MVLQCLFARGQTREHLLTAHDVHYALQVGRILPASDRNTDDHGYIAHSALVLVGICLICLGIGSIAVLFGDGLHLFKEAVRRVGRVKDLRKVVQHGLGIGRADPLGHGVIGLE